MYILYILYILCHAYEPMALGINELELGISLASSPFIKYKPDMHECKENTEHPSSVKEVGCFFLRLECFPRKE